VVKRMRNKLLFTMLICACLSNTLHAEYDPENLKSLFTNKNQRDQIDIARSGKATGTKQNQTSQINLSGYLTRSDGKSVVWLNDKSTLKNSTIDGARVHQSTIGNNKKVTVTLDGKTKSLKPGEVWSTEKGKAADNY